MTAALATASATMVAWTIWQRSGPNGTTIYVAKLYERTITSAGTRHLYHVLGPTGHIATIRRSATTICNCAYDAES